MTHNKSRIKTFLFILISIAFLALSVLARILTQTGLSAFNGVVLSVQLLLCLGLVLISYRTGFAISFSLLTISVIQMLIQLVFKHQISPLPGLCNLIIYTIMTVLLCQKLKTLDKIAVTDMLTGLKNRRGIYKILDHKIQSKKPFYLVYLDLGNFKMINDNYGHFYGDSLLKLTTERIKNTVGDQGLVTRIGGDEFVLIINEDTEVNTLTEQIIAEISKKADIALNDVIIQSYLTAYAGITHFPNDAEDSETLIKYADIAMFHATKNKASHINFFTKEMEQEFSRRNEVEKILKQALVSKGLYLNYQPQYEIQDKKLRGFEALLRLRTEDGTPISPAEFIPIAETSDLIFKIDDYVLNQMMIEFRDIVTSTEKDLLISVNVSAKNFADLGFVQKIKNLLDKNEYPAKNLEIEITEYCLVGSVETTIENIKKLREMGVHVALDDFGTGYTSLSYLSKMPINLLKVDKSLIDDIAVSEKSRDFVAAVISMGHIMGCSVISEGVEDTSQLETLKKQNCDFVQGYVWSKPISYDEAKTLVLTK